MELFAETRIQFKAEGGTMQADFSKLEDAVYAANEAIENTLKEEVGKLKAAGLSVVMIEDNANEIEIGG